MHTTSRTISLTGALCVAAWVVCMIFIIAATVLAFGGHENGLAWALALSNIGLLFGMVGGVMMVRGYFDRFSRQLEVREAEWERQAFELGVDYGQQRGPVRPIR